MRSQVRILSGAWEDRRGRRWPRRSLLSARASIRTCDRTAKVTRRFDPSGRRGTRLPGRERREDRAATAAPSCRAHDGRRSIAATLGVPRHGGGTPPLFVVRSSPSRTSTSTSPCPTNSTPEFSVGGQIPPHSPSAPTHTSRRRIRAFPTSLSRPRLSQPHLAFHRRPPNPPSLTTPHRFLPRQPLWTPYPSTGSIPTRLAGVNDVAHAVTCVRLHVGKQSVRHRHAPVSSWGRGATSRRRESRMKRRRPRLRPDSL